MKKSPHNLIWTDLEMTGLDPDNDDIIEIATVVTNSELRVLAKGPMIAIKTPESKLKAMDEWCTVHHTESGLWQRVMASTVTMREAEEQTLEFLRKWVEEGASPMCGNSICQDRRFMYRQMRELEEFFHYRNLDVSSIKELAVRWSPQIMDGFKKQNKHLAMDDILESINEMKYYRQFMGLLGGE